MNKSKDQSFLFKNITYLKGVGVKTKIILKRKKIEKIADLLWSFPQGFTDRSNLINLDSYQKYSYKISLSIKDDLINKDNEDLNNIYDQLN